MNQMENKTKLQYNNHSWIPFIFFYMCIASNVSSIIIILFKINKKIKRTRKNLGLLKGRTNVWLFDQSCMLVSGNLSNKFDSDVCCSNHCWFSILVLKFCTICIIQLFHFFLLGILLFILLLFKKKKKPKNKTTHLRKQHIPFLVPVFLPRNTPGVTADLLFQCLHYTPLHFTVYTQDYWHGSRHM